MPYEYRRLSPEQREEVLQKRRTRGYPLHAPPHPYRHAGCYLLTGVNFEHKHVMASPERRTEFEERLLQGIQEVASIVFAWVILPNHYHILVDVDSLDVVSIVIKQLHGSTSREWNLADGLTGQRQVWYRYADRLIRDERHFYQAMNYTHINPVKHHYVDTPYEWPWSSVHNYFEVYGRDWLRQRWQDYPPGDFGQGWDD